MPSSLFQDQHIVVSASLAATIGLEEAVMLRILGDCLTHRRREWRDGYHWVELPREAALELMPFWTDQDIDRVSRRLQSLGVIRLDSPTFMLADALRFALDEPAEAPARPQPAASAPPASASTPGPAARMPPRKGSTQIAADWQPGTELLRKLGEFHGIPADYAVGLVPEFVLYWSDRATSTFSWDARFMNHAVRAWQQLQTQSPPRESEALIGAGKPETAMHDHWQPGEDAVTILVRSGIDEEFIGEAVPEFILYWRDRGDICNTWDTKFIAHIRRQWARYETSLKYDTEPRPIDTDWEPCDDVFDILQMANIDEDFARSLVAEFVVYWRDTRQAHNSWNTRYLQYVKTQWARRHHWQQSPGQGYGRNIQSAVEPDRRGFVEKHTDQSWREGL